MDLPEIESRQDELDRIVHYLSDHDPRTFVEYQYRRGAELDALRPGVEPKL